MRYLTIAALALALAAPASADTLKHRVCRRVSHEAQTVARARLRGHSRAWVIRRIEAVVKNRDARRIEEDVVSDIYALDIRTIRREGAPEIGFTVYQECLQHLKHVHY